MIVCFSMFRAASVCVLYGLSATKLPIVYVCVRNACNNLIALKSNTYYKYMLIRQQFYGSGSRVLRVDRIVKSGTASALFVAGTYDGVLRGITAMLLA